MNTPRIRPLAIAVIWNGDSILVARGEDPGKNESFYRPLGGEIEFGEHSAAAVIREFKEEIDADITDLRLLTVLENVFTYNAKPGHEIMYVYEARFVDERLYAQLDIPVHEAGWFDVTWKKLDDFARERSPLYPDGLRELLRESPNHLR